MCAPAGGGTVGTPCASGADCRSELRCELDGLGGTCQTTGTGDVGASCVGASDCLAGLTCTAGGVCDRASEAFPPFPGVTCAADESPFRVFFEIPRPGQRLADFYRLPFPNDLRARADGTLDLSDFPRPGLTLLGVDLVDLYADAAEADFGGFASIDVVSFRFSAPLDFTSVQDGAALFFVDITAPGQPGFGANRGREFGYDPGKSKFACQNRLTLGNRTTDALEPGHTYAAWISTAARSATGATPTQDPDLIAMLGDTEPTDPTLARAWNQYAKFRAYLTAENRLPSTVAAAAVFTVQDASALARKLAAQVAAAPAPVITDLTLRDGVATSPCAPVDTGGACGDSAGAFWELHGRLAIPNYQAGTSALRAPGGRRRDHGRRQRRAGEARRPAGVLRADDPQDHDAGRRLAAGGPRPRHRRQLPRGDWRWDRWRARPPRRTPMATFTFDGVGHGERRGASGPDARQPVFNIVNPRAARDNHLQGAVDVLTALKLGDVAPITAPTVGTFAFDHVHLLLRSLAGRQRRHPGDRGHRSRPGRGVLRRRLGAGRGHPRQEAAGRRSRRAGVPDWRAARRRPPGDDDLAACSSIASTRRTTRRC